MRIAFQEIKKASVALVDQYTEAAAIASRLRLLMDAEPLYSMIQERHTLGAKSQAIQALLVPGLEQLGFQSERRGLFAQYQAAGLRPDFYRPLENSGILLEVERGRVLTNNMDLLDLWKCHVCSHTDFLFLIVPIARRSKNGKPIKGFDGASRRLSLTHVTMSTLRQCFSSATSRPTLGRTGARAAEFIRPRQCSRARPMMRSLSCSSCPSLFDRQV